MLRPNPTKSIVLYADDDPDDRELISHGFTPYKGVIDITTFINGAALLDYINSLSPLENTPCLIILDINMPLLNGLQTLKLIRQQKGFESTPIILFTTSVSEPDRQFIKKYNSKVLLKPIETSQFNGIIQEFISHCREGLPENDGCT